MSKAIPEIQAVFFDFDHTLYSHKTKTIPQSAKDAIKNLQEKESVAYWPRDAICWSWSIFPKSSP